MSYQEALVAAGCDVLQFEEFGSYQGEWLALVSHGGFTGIVEGSYGSCSGCDAFESEFGYDFNLDCYDSEKPDYQQRLAEFGNSYLPPVSASDWISMQEARLKRHTDEDNYCWDSEASEMLDTVKKWSELVQWR